MSLNISKNRLALGTVQFGLDYGISNLKGKVDLDEVKKILNYANISGINLLDSASGYGNSEKILGDIGIKNFAIVSKFISISKDKFITEFFKTLSDLKTKKIYALLAHKPKSLFNNIELWNELTYLKRKKLIKKIGFSFNEISEVEKMNELNIIPDIVQIPYNIFDRRFSKIILDLSNRGVEIHTRSSFLQGLFFISPDKLSNKHNVFIINIIELKKISDKFGLSIEHLALSFCLSNKYIDRVLIGVHNLSQLKNNLQALKNPINDEIINELKDLSLGNHNMLNPSNW